jgi:hypothetical protein
MDRCQEGNVAGATYSLFNGLSSRQLPAFPDVTVLELETQLETLHTALDQV